MRSHFLKSHLWICFLGILLSLILLFTTSLSDKYALALSMGFISSLLILIIKNKEKILIAAFLFSLPISMGFKLIERHESTNHTVRLLFQIYLSDCFLIAICFLLFLKIWLKKAPAMNLISHKKFIIPLLFWIGMGFLSLIPAIDHIATTVGIIRIVRVLLTFIIISIFLENREDMHFVLACLIVACFCQSLLMFAQYATNSLAISYPGATMAFDVVEEGLRPSGTMSHSSHFAKFAGVMLPITLSYVFFTPTLRRNVLFFLIWVCGSIALVLTISRAGIATWLFSIIIFFVGLLYLRIISLRNKLSLLIVCLLIVGIAIGTLYIFGGQRLKNRTSYDAGSFAARLSMYKVAFNVIKANPIFGVGLNNYTLVHQDYDQTPEHISVLQPDDAVHNLFLLYGAEIGIPGLLFFLWFLIKILKCTFRCISHELVYLDKAIYLSMMISIMALILQSLTGKGVSDHLIHLSVIAIFAACVAKNDLFFKKTNNYSVRIDPSR